MITVDQTVNNQRIRRLVAYANQELFQETPVDGLTLEEWTKADNGVLVYNDLYMLLNDRLFVAVKYRLRAGEHWQTFFSWIGEPAVWAKPGSLIDPESLQGVFSAEDIEEIIQAYVQGGL